MKDFLRDMRTRTLADGHWWRPRVSTEALAALASAWLALALNGPLWGAVQAGSGSLRVLLSLGVAVFALHALLFGLLCWGRLARPLLALLMPTAALVPVLPAALVLAAFFAAGFALAGLAVAAVFLAAGLRVPVLA